MRAFTGLLVVALTPGAFACSLKIVYSDVAAPPYIVGNGEQVPAAPGVAVELVNDAAQAVGCKLNWIRLPNRRVQTDMERGQADAMLMYSYNPERAKYAVYPMKDGKPDGSFRLAALSYYVYVKSSSPTGWDGKQFSSLTGPVGVNAGYSVAVDLTKMGLMVDEARSTEQNFTKLRMGRISVYVMQDGPADLVIEDGQLSDVQKLPLPFSTKDYFLPFSQRYFDTSSTEGLRLWEQIGKTKKSRVEELLMKYSETP
jgi:polar amino acid transport system substrate-binding protein